MDGAVRIARSRGSVCGLLLVLLGLWGGIVPFIGPYFHFAYTPDRAWAYTSGRLYLSVIPGAVALVGGVLAALTRSRAVGVAGGVLAVLAGAWFITGAQFTAVVLRSTTISPGTPISGTLLASRPGLQQYAEQLGFFVAVGALLILLGGIVMGRFSMISARDAEDAAVFDGYEEGQPPAESVPAVSSPFTPTTGEMPAVSGQFPATARQAPPPFPPRE
jgi:hypothetical protein